MHTLLARDMPMAIAYLTKMLETLDTYANMASPTMPAGLGQPGGTDKGDNQSKASDSASRASPASNGKCSPWR